MKHFLTAVIIALLTTSCSGHSFKYLKKPTPIIKGEAKYRIVNVTINFEDTDHVFGIEIPQLFKKDFSAYPNQEQLSLILKNLLDKKLKESGIYSSDSSDPQSFSISMIATHRRLAPIWSKSAYHSFNMSHEITISKKGKNLARSILPIYRVTHGFSSDLRGALCKKGPKDEVDDMDTLSNVIVMELVNLGEQL